VETAVLVETPLVPNGGAGAWQQEQAGCEAFAVGRALAGLAAAAHRHGPCELHPDNQVLETLPAEAPNDRAAAAARVRVRHRRGERLARWHLEDAPPGYLEIWLEARTEAAPAAGSRMPAGHAWWMAALGHWLGGRGWAWQWTHQGSPWRPGPPTLGHRAALAGADAAPRQRHEAVLIDLVHAWLAGVAREAPTSLTAHRGRRAGLRDRARRLVHARDPALQAVEDLPAADTEVITALTALLSGVAAAVEHAGPVPGRSGTPAEHGACPLDSTKGLA
jgi:hypothetical protein